MRALLILNRTAGDEEPPTDQLSTMQTWLARAEVAADVVFTSEEMPAGAIAREALMRGVQLFIVGGGDGTVSEVARELIGKEATLAILPVGTFNNIARSIGIVPELAAACGAITEGHTAEIDIGVINDRDYFFEAAGAGLDATLFPIGEEVKSGRWHRMWEAARLTFQYRRPQFAITLDRPIADVLTRERRKRIPRRWRTERTIRRRALLVVVANGPYYGTGFTVAPGARLSDGKLTISIYRKFSKLQLARHFWSISRGRYHYSPNIETFHAREVTIASPASLPVHADGKPSGKTPVTIRVVRRALRVIVPKQHVKTSAIDAPVALPAEEK
jgi:diacylglycerol kinase (ATP)